MPAGYVAVIGAVNVDIRGRSFAPLIARDSNPGEVRTSFGGVGRNIAHNLRRLGVGAEMLTVLGGDDAARRIEADCASAGIVLHAVRVANGQTSSYLYITGPDGDMALAVCDADLTKHVTPAVIEQNLALLNGAELVVLDGNLTEKTIACAAAHIKKPLFADPVSVTKSEKLKPFLDRLHTIKPNRLEAELLTGHKVETAEDAEAAAQILLDKGIRQAYVSLGTEGVLAAQGEERIFFPSFKSETVSLTGAGDAFTAGLVYEYFQDEDFAQAGRTASAAAAIAIQSMETINERMSPGYLRRVIRENKEDVT